MKTIFKEVQLINTDSSVEIIEEEMICSLYSRQLK